MSSLLAPIEHRRQGFHPTLIHSPTRTGWPPSQQPTTADMAMCLRSSLLRHTRLRSSLIPVTTRRMQPPVPFISRRGREDATPEPFVSPPRASSWRPVQAAIGPGPPAQPPALAQSLPLDPAGAAQPDTLPHFRNELPLLRSRRKDATPPVPFISRYCRPEEARRVQRLLPTGTKQPRSSMPPTMGMPLHLDDAYACTSIPSFRTHIAGRPHLRRACRHHQEQPPSSATAAARWA